MERVVKTVVAVLLAQAAFIRGDEIACGANRPRVLEGTTGNFQSPNFPSDYPNNANCEWLINSPSAEGTVRVEFDEFNTESRYDSVRMYDGSTTDAPLLVTASGGKPAAQESTGNSMLVSFTSDSSVTRSGFSGKFLSDQACSANGPSVLTAPSGTVSSAYYPNNYGAGLRCNWTIQTSPGRALSIDFEAFDLEESETEICRWDYLDVYDGESLVGRFCGNEGPNNFVSSSNEVRIFFRSDLAIEQGGFLLNYESVNGGGVTIPSSQAPSSPGPSTTPGPATTPGPSTTPEPISPPPEGLFLEIAVTSSTFSVDGSAISGQCAAVYAAAMRPALAEIIVTLDALMGSSVCSGATDVGLLGGTVTAVASADTVSFLIASYLIPSSVRDFRTHHECSREIVAYMTDVTNWRSPIIGDVLGCPVLSEDVSFNPAGTFWAC